MSVQTNCCPVKGRDHFSSPLPNWHALANVQLPPCHVGAIAGLCCPLRCARALLGGAQVGLAAIMPGTMLEACRMGDCVPKPGFASSRFADVSTLYLGRARSAPQVWAVAPFPTCVPSGWIMRYLDLPFQGIWDELGSSYGLEEVLRFFYSSVRSQEEALSGPELLSPLSSCNPVQC